MSKKALFLDLDGTLLNDQKEISEGNRTAIQRMLSAGHIVVINTGRPLVSAIKQAKALSLDKAGCFLIAFNGALIYDFAKEEAIFKKGVSLETVKRIFAQARERNLHIQTYDDAFVLVEKRCDNAIVRKYCDTILMDFRPIENLSQLSTQPIKMLAIDYENHEALASFQSWINEHEQLTTFFSTEFYLEILGSGLNKGSGMLRLCEALDIPVKNTIAAGDAANDIQMIKTAHLGVCMANGTNEAKAVADYITFRDNNHDGIAEIIERFILA